MGDRSFKINFGSDGTSRLREKVNEKLKEVMGDYMDDTLVEYVLVLLRNGRTKDEATRELNVFLGDEDSISFVSWLWDHLSSNLKSYAAPKELLPEHEKPNSIQEQACENFNSESEKEGAEFSKISRRKERIEWKHSDQEIRDSFPLRSTVTKILRSEYRDDIKSNARRSVSPRPRFARKRSVDDDQPMKRDENGASRRLLQFAVRDAVKTVQSTIVKPVQSTVPKPVPALKRLRSVVSTSTPDTVEEPQRVRSVALMAAAEAAEDTAKIRYPRSVFDRISSGPEYDKESVYDEDVSMLDGNSNINHGSLPSNRYNNDGASASSVYKPKDSLTLQYNVGQNANEVARDARFVDQGLNYNRKDKSSGDIVNISVNVNTWKPPNYVVPRAVSKVESQMVVNNNNNNAVTVGRTNTQLPKENDAAMTEKEMVQTNVQSGQQKTVPSAPASYTANRPSEDSESRTVYVSNVHFAATKDALSRHFNKFGEVLKVIILNDPTTCQPKGAAYVEFLRKESAESALSLNGTYFMSRSLKVVRKIESAEVAGWPRVARAQPFASSGSRTAFPRGGFNHGAFRGRPTIKPGARSLQWKRDGPSPHAASTANNVLSPTTRNLTYVRPELKVNPSTGSS